MQSYACAILLRGREILLGRRSPERRAYPSTWDILGGRVEDGESAEAALLRELGEEIGIAPTEFRHIKNLFDDNVGGRGAATYHVYVVTAWSGGEPVINNHEHSALKWFPIADACDLPDLALPYLNLFLTTSPSPS